MEQLPSRQKTIIRTSAIGIGANIGLVAIKAFVGFLAGSIAVIMDALNNLTDALSSLITMIGTRLSVKKPDKKHPYGHGRVEYLTSLIIAILILVAGGAAIYRSILGIVEDPKGQIIPSYALYSLILIGVGVLVKVGLGIYFRLVGKKVDSQALKASGADALFDAALSLSTLVAALISYFAGLALENYFALVIGAFILRSGIGVLRESFSSIIGERADKETVQNLRALVLEDERVKGVYDIIINNYGPSKMIASAHIEVDASLKAQEIHLLTRDLSEKVYLKMGMILTLGIYSSGVESEISMNVRKDLTAILADFPEVIQIHGFYVKEDAKEIGFDLIIDFKQKEPEKTIEAIRAKLQERYPEHLIKIVLDLDFSD